ncbi:putative leucine-rich repeat domain, L domain-containing protein [Medicago truncatula]|uniref:Putative leucine-rich repeat domain, L domain-containing protein n=1 Tax=Medicago truncatula TaxID=3880 RepID=A0A396HRW8_MEDTR|nr:disease resistance protein RGA2 [Medicago truncatula]RHN55233.1 putative leucine-rich repeat domain, L domain-containing protein [Medicago truncatula]
MSKHFMIELWIANGFISSNQMLDAEGVGNEVWNELYWRSFFQDTETDEFGQITSFKMHDLVHELAESVTREVCCITYNNDLPTVSESIRHLSVYKENSFEIVNSIQLHHAKSLKTYLAENFNVFDAGQLSPQVLKCYSLRVLLSNRLNKLPTSIGGLKYLRYLDISEGSFNSLPKSLCKLYNLQVLKLDACYNLQKLPDGLTCLKALQHLSLRGCDSLSSLPPHLGKLNSLKTLSKYIVGNKRGFLLEELGQLNLKGQLHIKNLERVKSVADAKKANISRKKLNHLWLSWERNEVSQLQENIEQILEALQPYAQQLYSCGIGGYTGAHFPPWIASPSLKDLSSLELVDCKSCLNLPELWKLPSLKYLNISNMIHALQELYIYHCKNIRSITNEVLKGLHSLKVLNIMKCNKFNMSSGFQYLTCLETLVIGSCSEVNGFHEALQHMTSLQSLTLSDLPNLRISA